MESIASNVLIGIGVFMALWYLLFAHCVSVIARKTGQGNTAEVLSYVPFLQIIPMIWSGGGSPLKAFVVYLALLFANFLAGVAAGMTDSASTSGAVVLGSLSLGLLPSLYVGLISWRTAQERGLPGFVGALNFLTSFLIHPVIAFHDGWARPHRVGASVGVTLCLLMLVPLAIFGDEFEEALAEAKAASEASALETEVAGENAFDPEDFERRVAEAEAAQMPETVAVEDADAPGGRAATMPAPVAIDHEQSIRALLSLQGRFDQLAEISTPEAGAEPDGRARALSLVGELRAELAAKKEQLDAGTYAELEHQLAMTVARIEGRAPSDDRASGGVRLANASARTPDSARTMPPAALDAANNAAPTRPFPVRLSESCPDGTELASRASEKGEEEWCQQVARAGGLRHGWYARFFDDGRPEQVGEYRDGMRVGVWTRFYRGGEIRAQAEFREGMQHGWLLSFDRDGTRQKALRFDQGSPVR